MKFWEAMRELEAGKKVRSVMWTKGNYTSNHISLDENQWTDIPVIQAVNAEWELYEEPDPVLVLSCYKCNISEMVSRHKAKEWKCPKCQKEIKE